jgi:DNA-binding transcriptional ArsR family regulator
VQFAAEAQIDALGRVGRTLGDPIRCRLLLALCDGLAYPADLADGLPASRSNFSNQLACLRGCALVVAVPEGRGVRYELADSHFAGALAHLLGVVLAVDPECTYADAVVEVAE